MEMAKRTKKKFETVEAVEFFSRVWNFIQFCVGYQRCVGKRLDLLMLGDGNIETLYG